MNELHPSNFSKSRSHWKDYVSSSHLGPVRHPVGVYYGPYFLSPNERMLVVQKIAVYQQSNAPP